MNEEDEILRAKWEKEEREKRQKELVKLSKPKRSIEAGTTFGYVSILSKSYYSRNKKQSINTVQLSTPTMTKRLRVKSFQ